MNATDFEQLSRTALQLLAERLLAWTDEAIEVDLAAYDDVPSCTACEARDLLLAWVKDAASEESEGRNVPIVS